MVVTCTDEDVRYVGDAIQGALRAPTYAASHHGHARRLRLGLIDPDCVLLVDCGSGEVRPGRRGEPGVTGFVAMAAGTAVGVCRGQVDLAAALAAGDIVMDGEGAALLELFAGITERELVAVG
ncbi:MULTISPECIES: hypothetical protein [unclassified Nocardioides]|uniref:hypothetical protein n=1 Tax=unclassified Nocardioides TaxID=2615069 RepID=UPI0006F7931F|nr:MULTISPECIES: hypothetical protein [unclassified Nocardioides]KRA37739.1 hypothetical protein ASD81_03320 [Nocardioides sp. Root614]KRA91699.1 hypothetical protein ASD84_03585 [Nocardioides sp. Root682]